MKPEIIELNSYASAKRDSSLKKASVVIINLNQGHYLEDCILSVVNQTYKNIEILLQDGGSTDGSLDLLKRFPQVEVVSERDLSSSHAFSKGAARAKGDYLFFLNSSDGFYSQDWVENAVNALEKYRYASMVTGAAVGIDSNSNINNYIWPKKATESKSPKVNFYSWLFDGIGFTPITFCIRISVFLDCSMDEDEFLDPRDPNSVDFFWNLSEKFFSKGYISIRSNEKSAFVRLHEDRVDDSSYLFRQLDKLNNFIIEFRRRLIFGKQKYYFVNPDNSVSVFGEMKREEIFWNFLISKFRHYIKSIGKLVKICSTS